MSDRRRSPGRTDQGTVERVVMGTPKAKSLCWLVERLR